MTIADLLKNGMGLVEGVGKSKKLGLVAAFVTACMVMASESGTTTERIAALAAATLAVCAYVLAQGRVEAKGAELVQVDEAGAEK